ncbi:MAG: TIGR04076 family protein [Candidatus Thorarchaeota archaeon]
MTRIRIRVHDIRGSCPVFKVGDEIVIDGAELVMSETNAYCVWAAASFTPYLHAIRAGVPPNVVGLATHGSDYYVQCLDPGPPLTPGGTVVFKMSRESEQ